MDDFTGGATKPLGDLTTLGGFELKEKLGEGGQGIVYRGVRSYTSYTEAAIKVVFRRPKDEGTVLRFIREVSMAARLSHRYAAKIYSFGTETTVLWVAMEFVQGKGLDRQLKEQGALPLVTAVPLMERICDVVKFAHGQGMIHRDLKPANVMLVSATEPKLLDFGIAKTVTSSNLESARSKEPLNLPTGRDQLTSRSGVVVGSPPYMSPESWTTPAQVDFRTDLYALGVMTYELIAGRRPFHAQNSADMMRLHLEGPIPMLPGMPDALNAVLQRAMAKDPRQRHDSASLFAAELREAAGLDKG